MSSECHSFFEFVAAVHQATSFEEAFSAFEKQVFQLGFDGALYVFIPRISLDTSLPQAPVYQFSDSYSPAYISHYIDAGFFRNDPIVKAMEGGDLNPLDWWTEIKKGHMNKAEENVIVVAREDYQMTHGLTIPTMADSRGIACVSVISNDNTSLYAKARNEGFDQLKLGAQVLHGAVLSNAFHLKTFVEPLVARLSTTERGFLRKLVEGKKMKTIAFELNVGEKYIDKVASSAREKLSLAKNGEGQSISREQLIYYIGLLNLLEAL